MLKHRLIVLVLLAVTVSGCAAGRAFRKGQEAERAGDFDTAVTEFTRAVQEDPTRAEFRISLERATQNASREHITRAHEFELKDQLDLALIEYKRAVELDATNRLAAARVVELEKTIRDRIEASRPRPAIEKMREDARAQALPLLNPASRQPIKINFSGSLKDLLNFLGANSGINITYDPAWRDKPYTVTHGRGDARAGAPADPLDQPVVLQGRQPQDDPRRRRRGGHAPEVRRDGDPGLLHLARGRRRAGAAAQHDHADEHDGGAAVAPAEQDGQHDHRPRDGAGGGRHRARHPRQRQAARRSDRGRADPGSEQEAHEGAGAEPQRLRARADVLAGGGAAQHRRRHRDQRRAILRRST